MKILENSKAEDMLNICFEYLCLYSEYTTNTFVHDSLIFLSDTALSRIS